MYSIIIYITGHVFVTVNWCCKFAVNFVIFVKILL